MKLAQPYSFNINLQACSIHLRKPYSRTLLPQRRGYFVSNVLAPPGRKMRWSVSKFCWPCAGGDRGWSLDRVYNCRSRLGGSVCPSGSVHELARCRAAQGAAQGIDSAARRGRDSRARGQVHGADEARSHCRVRVPVFVFTPSHGHGKGVNVALGRVLG